MIFGRITNTLVVCVMGGWPWETWGSQNCFPKIICHKVVVCVVGEGSDQKGMVFFLSCYHIQNCRSSEKIGRKEII